MRICSINPRHLICFFSVLFLVLTVNIPASHAQDLPDGAIARLGKGSVGDIAYFPDGSRFAMASSLGLWIYDAHTGEELALLSGRIDPYDIAISPDGNTIVSVNSDDTVGVWDVATGKQKFALRGHRGSLTCIAFSPDGLTIASGSEYYDVPGECEVRLWDAATGQEKAVFIYDDEPSPFFGDRQDQVTSVTFSPDSRLIATGHDGPAAVIRDAITGERKHTLRVEVRPGVFAGGGYVWDIAFSPDGNTLAGPTGSREGTMVLWDVATGEQKILFGGHTWIVGDIDYSPDGRAIVSASWLDDTIRLWDATTGQEQATFVGHTGGVNSIAFNPDGRTIVSRSGRRGDNTVRLWDVGTSTLLNTLTGYTSGVYSVAFSPDGRTLASGSRDNTVRLWNVGTSTLLNTLTGHTDWVRSVAFSPDGRTLASGSWDDTVRLWDATTGEHLNTLTGHTGEVGSVAFSPDGRTLASGSWDDTVRLWDATTGEHLNTLTGHTDRVYSVAFSPDGRTLASGSWDNTVYLWNVETGAHLNTLIGHTDYVYSVAFSPDGRTLASGSGIDDSVRLWDAVRGQLLNTFIGHTGWVRSVAFSPDGRTLASGSTDSTVILWELTPPPPADDPLDVNGDGQVTVIDLAIVALLYGTEVPAGVDLPADVNADGIVNILDLTAVAQGIDAARGNAFTLNALEAALAAAVEIEAIAEAPMLGGTRPDNFRDSLYSGNRAYHNVADALADAGHLGHNIPAVLTRLLQLLKEIGETPPETTALLPNYPNPFNPETWIPYQLANASRVQITIFDTRGTVVRKLDLGHQQKDYYMSKVRAAYWDGKNQFGEPVASGIYFYTLTAGDFNATRKLLIAK